MNFSNIFSREVTSQPSAQAEESKGAKYTSRIQYVNNAQTALTVAAFYRGVDIISSTIAEMPIEFLIWNSQEKRFAPDQLQKGQNWHKLLNVKPNRRLNAYQFKKRAVALTITQGYAVIYPRMNSKADVTELVLVTRGCATYDVISNTWTLSDPWNDIPTITLPADRLIILNNSFCDNRGVGISTIEYASNVLTQSRTLTNESINRAATGGRVKAIISNNTPSSGGMGKYSKQQLKKAKSDLQEQIDAGYDIYEVAGDTKVSNMSLSAADLQFIESQKFSVMDVARYLGVPLPLLMESSGTNYKSGENADIDFLTHCIGPRMEDILCEFNSKLISDGNYMKQKFVFDHSILHHMDLATLGNYQKTLIETGQASPNDLRRKANLSPVDNGDIYYVSTNLAVVGSEKLSGTTLNQ